MVLITPIHVDGGDDFGDEWTGSGTEEDPYELKEEYEIDASGYSYGIWIERSNKHVIIENTEIHGSSEEIGAGIRFESVGNAEVRNNKIHDNITGIYVESNALDETNYWENNHIHSNGKGVHIHQASYNEFTNNQITGNTGPGLYGKEATDSRFHGNTIHYNSGHGIHFYFYCTHNLIEDNEIKGNEEAGIYLDYVCNETQVTENLSKKNFRGIRVEDSGLVEIWRNRFIGNTERGYDDYGGYYDNVWDKGDPAEGGEGGNYWSDYVGFDRGDGVGRSPYELEGGDLKDDYPWMLEDMQLTDKIRRMIAEGDILHGADWTALWWTAVGSGMIVPAADMCKPEIAVIEDGYQRGVRVKGGKVLHSGEVCEVEEEVIGLMNNLGEEERYDVVYLKYVVGEGVVLDAKIGVPCEKEALHPDLIDETGEIVTPIAVAYLEKDATEISELKDVRWIPNAEHSHRAGSGLELDEDYLMNVVTDEETVLIENDELVLGEVGGHELELNDGKGIDYYEYWDEVTEEWEFVYRIDEDDGLYIGEADELVLSPWAFVGEGLEIEEVDGEDRIRVTDGDGLMIDGGSLTARTGLGTKIGAEGELTVATLGSDGPAPSGGVTKGSSGIAVEISHLTGSGMEEVSGNLGVNAGSGLQLSSGALEVVRGEGIKSVGTKVGLDLQSGGGLGIDGDNALYAASAEAAAGSGLYEDSSGYVNVGQGDGLTISASGAYVNDGDGVRTNNGEFVAYVNPWNGVKLINGELSIDPSDFVGDGLYVSNGKLHVNTGAGTQTTSDGLAVDPKSGGGLTINQYDRLGAAPSDFAGGWIRDHMKVDENDRIQIDPSSVFNLIAETTVTINSIGQKEGIWITDYTNRYPLVMGIAFLDQASSIAAGIQVRKLMIDENSESGAYGNNVWCGVECVGTIGSLDPESAEILIRVYEARMDLRWGYNY